MFIAGLGRMDFISIHAHLCLKFHKQGIKSNNFVFRSILNRFLFSQDFKKLCNSVDVASECNYLLDLSFYELKKLMYTNFCNRPSSRK